MHTFYYCANCKKYTLKEICPTCAQKTENKSYKFLKVGDQPNPKKD